MVLVLFLLLLLFSLPMNSSNNEELLKLSQRDEGISIISGLGKIFWNFINAKSCLP